MEILPRGQSRRHLSCRRLCRILRIGVADPYVKSRIFIGGIKEDVSH